MAKKTEAKTEKIEREYIIPLREKCRVVPRYKKTPKAIRVIKEFLIRHMKIRDKDLNKIKINKYLNEFLWTRGIKHPPHKIKVKAIKEGEIVKVELVDFPDKIKFKKLREEKRESSGEVVAKKKKEEKEVVEEKKEMPEEEKREEKEKKSAVVESGIEMEKSAAKQQKHITSGKSKELKHQFRQALRFSRHFLICLQVKVFPS